MIVVVEIIVIAMVDDSDSNDNNGDDYHISTFNIHSPLIGHPLSINHTMSLTTSSLIFISSSGLIAIN